MMEDPHNVRELLPRVWRMAIELNYKALLEEFLSINIIAEELDFIKILSKRHLKEFEELSESVDFTDESYWELNADGSCEGYENKKRKDLYFYLKQYLIFLEDRRKELQETDVTKQSNTTPVLYNRPAVDNQINFGSFFQHKEKDEIIKLLQDRYSGSKPAVIFNVFFSLMSLGLISKDFKNESTKIGEALSKTFSVSNANSLKSGYGRLKQDYPDYIENDLDFRQTKEELKTLLLSYLT